MAPASHAHPAVNRDALSLRRARIAHLAIVERRSLRDIAAQLGCSHRTVRRDLAAWRQETQAHADVALRQSVTSLWALVRESFDARVRALWDELQALAGQPHQARLRVAILHELRAEIEHYLHAVDLLGLRAPPPAPLAEQPLATPHDLLIARAELDRLIAELAREAS